MDEIIDFIASKKNVLYAENFFLIASNVKMSRGNRDRNYNCKVYVGNLGDNASKHELEDVFRRYGKVRSVWVARNPPGFAFVEFEDERDAEDASKALDGSRICGVRATVEMSSRKKRNRRVGGRDYRRRYDSGRSSSSGRRDDRSKRTSNRGRRDSRTPSRDRSFSRERNN
ncbi:SFRS3 [Lepeophtheirus salmonis]|uniref:SFRS3 n=1 Tax=Lepeophtheirus salmonis TaxID=72036 RepID=A0A7R8CQ22_LEPSM|nr:SFRS3 [Lepeophtheirus salmonis]CAF2858603.1 SFRS3 [Lepeophtheirus salmonis]